MIRNVSEKSEKISDMTLHRKNISTIIRLGLMVVLILPVVFSNETSQSVRDSLQLCFNTVIPSLFPFLVLIPLVISSGVADGIGRFLAGPVKLLFSLPGYCSFPIVIGFMSGCPGSAGAVRDMYNSGKCTKDDAEKVIAFCNNMSPSFFISGIGAGMFGNVFYGVVLFVVQIISSVVAGVVICRGMAEKRVDYSEKGGNVSDFAANEKCFGKNFTANFVSSVKNAASNMISISAFVVFFGVISDQISLLFSYIGFSSEYMETVFKMFLEITSGCRTASLLETEKALILISAGAGWAGISSHAQVMSIVHECGFSMKKYFVGKVLQSSLAAFFMTFAIKFIK